MNEVHKHYLKRKEMETINATEKLDADFCIIQNQITQEDQF